MNAGATGTRPIGLAHSPSQGPSHGATEARDIGGPFRPAEVLATFRRQGGEHLRRLQRLAGFPFAMLHPCSPPRRRAHGVPSSRRLDPRPRALPGINISTATCYSHDMRRWFRLFSTYGSKIRSPGRRALQAILCNVLMKSIRLGIKGPATRLSHTPVGPARAVHSQPGSEPPAQE
jgi:hypothetical protein